MEININSGTNHIEAAIQEIEAAISAIEVVIFSQKENKSKLEIIRNDLYQILDNKTSHKDIKPSFETTAISATPAEQPKQNEIISKSDPQDFKDYPFEKKLPIKLNYLDSILQKPFKMRDRLALIGKIEGEEKMKELKPKISCRLNYLVTIGVYISGKYNGRNTLQFYFKPDWLIKMGEDKYTIKEGFEPLEKDFGSIPAHQRRVENIKWISGNK